MRTAPEATKLQTRTKQLRLDSAEKYQLAIVGRNPPDWMTDAAKRMNGALRARTDDVMQDFVELKKDMAKLADAATKAVRREVRSAKGQLNDVRHSIEERAQNSIENVTGQVRERPLAALGVAAGTGF